MTKATPLITPTFRAAWADMLANDPQLSPTAVRVGIILGGHFNNYTAETYANQKTLARKAKISSRTAWTCLQRLVRCGHLTKRRGGRRSDIYGMPLASVATYCNIYFDKSRNPLRNIPEETSQDRSESLATAEGKSLKTRCDEEVTLPTNSNSEEANLDKSQTSDWPKFTAYLADWHGQIRFDAWFSNLTFIGIRENVCILGLPTKYLKFYFEAHYVDSVLNAWQRSQESTITKIEFQVVPRKGGGGSKV